MSYAPPRITLLAGVTLHDSFNWPTYKRFSVSDKTHQICENRAGHAWAVCAALVDSNEYAQYIFSTHRSNPCAREVFNDNTPENTSGHVGYRMIKARSSGVTGKFHLLRDLRDQCCD